MDRILFSKGSTHIQENHFQAMSWGQSGCPHVPLSHCTDYSDTDNYFPQALAKPGRNEKVEEDPLQSHYTHIGHATFTGRGYWIFKAAEAAYML